MFPSPFFESPTKSLALNEPSEELVSRGVPAHSPGPGFFQRSRSENERTTTGEQNVHEPRAEDQERDRQDRDT